MLTRRLAAAAVIAAAALSAPPALAAPVKVSGRVRAGASMTVIALAPNGSATRARVAAKGGFSLKLRSARGVTLQLLRRNGSYYGPVVLARHARTGYATLGGRSVRLGDIVLAPGYGRTRKGVAARALNRRSSIALDAKGAPLGVLRHGVVRMPHKLHFALHAAAETATGDAKSGGDPDRDGIPSALDLDANGNGRLDNFDPGAPSIGDGFFSGLYTDMRAALNLDATPGLSRSAIDAAISGPYQFNLAFYFDEGRFRGGEMPTGAHVDCGALSYCRRDDGTAIMSGFADAQDSIKSGHPWVGYTPDGSGFPNLAHIQNNGGVWAMAIAPHATTAEINPGDTYDVVFDMKSGEVHVPTALTAYFVTTPAIAAWGSDGGASTPVPYPVGNGAGTSDGNPMQLDSGRLSLTIWRPQRRAVEGAESTAFVDQGHLHYGVVASTPDGMREIACGGYYNGLSSTLTAQPLSQDFATHLTPLLDNAGDSAPDPDRTLSFTVDLGACLSAQGVDPWGQTVRLTLTAAGEPRRGGMDRAAQMFTVRFPAG